MTFKEWLERPVVLKRGKLLICKKDIFKSTYCKNAFDNKKQYNVVELDSRYPWVQANDPELIWVLDNEGQSFSFTKHQETGMHFIKDYFEEVKR